jgi:hypothetical protein
MQSDDEREAAEAAAVWAILRANPNLAVRNWFSSSRDKKPPTFVVSSVREQQIENQSGDEQKGNDPVCKPPL